MKYSKDYRHSNLWDTSVPWVLKGYEKKGTTVFGGSNSLSENNIQQEVNRSGFFL